MMPPVDEFRDDRLAEALRRALGRERAPQAWVQEALEIPARFMEQTARLRRKDPLLPWILPQLVVAAVALGIVVAALLLPERLSSMASFLERSPAAGSLLTPLLLLILADGARGFALLRRWLF